MFCIVHTAKSCIQISQMQVETKHKTVAACLLMAHTGGLLKTNVRKTLNSYHERKLLFCSSLAVGSLATDEDSLPGK